MDVGFDAMLACVQVQASTPNALSAVAGAAAAAAVHVVIAVT